MGGMITVIAVGLFLILANWSVRNSRPKQLLDGSLELRYPFFLRVMAGIVGATGLCLASFMLVGPFFDKDFSWWAAVIAFLSFSGLSSWILLEFLRRRAIIDHWGLRMYSPWHTDRACAWKDITQIRYSMSGAYVIESFESPVIQMSTWLSGVFEFKEMAREKLPENRYITAFSADPERDRKLDRLG